MRLLDRCYVVEDPAANSVMGAANSLRGAANSVGGAANSITKSAANSVRGVWGVANSVTNSIRCAANSVGGAASSISSVLSSGGLGEASPQTFQLHPQKIL